MNHNVTKHLMRKLYRTCWHLTAPHKTLKFISDKIMATTFAKGPTRRGLVITGMAAWGEAGDRFDETVRSLKRTGINHQSAPARRSEYGRSSARRWDVQELIRNMQPDGSWGGLPLIENYLHANVLIIFLVIPLVLGYYHVPGNSIRDYSTQFRIGHFCT